jgi:seryl-tRNA synthetase
MDLSPALVNEQSLWASGQLPKFLDNLYHDYQDDLWLVPTAEVPLTNMYRDEIIAPGQLPYRYVAYTPCFRREKMSAGRDVRGIKRLHQFDKVEMYTFCEPEHRWKSWSGCSSGGGGLRPAGLLTASSDLHRRPRLQRRDRYDIEVWSVGQQEWLEVAPSQRPRLPGASRESASGGSTAAARSIPTLNGSGLALPRVVIAIREQPERGRLDRGAGCSATISADGR